MTARKKPALRWLALRPLFVISEEFSLRIILSATVHLGLLLLAAVYAFNPLSSGAANITWTGGDGTWSEGVTTGWTPVDEPDSNDAAIFNTANAVSLGSNNTVNGLTLSNGIDLFTKDFDLTVDGLVQLSDSGTNLLVGGTTSLLMADSITINNLTNLQLDGGGVQIDEELGNGLLDINVGGELLGHGTLTMTDAVAATTTLIVNDGFITAQRSPLVIFGAPMAGTLAINATDTDVRIDLDGAGEAGAVIVRRNQTLDINVPLSDIFNGSIDMFQNSTLDVSTGWTLGAGATLDIDNGFIDGTFPNPDTPAGVAIIKGGAFSQNSGTITVLDSDGTLQFDAPFSLNGGSFVNNGLVIFNSSTTIAAAANFTMPTTASSLTVADNRTVNINQNNFNLDGSNSATNIITVNTGATLNITTSDYDPDSATNAFDGTVNLNNGTISVSTSDAEFVMDGVLNSTASGSDQSLWTGETLAIGNDAGSRDADVNILGSQPTQFGSGVRFLSDADVNIADGATMHFLSVANFNTVNGGNTAEFTGSGEMIFSGTANFTEAVTLNLVGGIVDLDGADSVGDTINVDAPLVINAELMRSFGKSNGGGGTNLIDVNNSVATGVLTVNLDNAADEWTLNLQGRIQLTNDATAATLLAGSDINVNGEIQVSGACRTDARIDIGTTGAISVGNGRFILSGGNTTDDPNTFNGGTISGALGILGADAGTALHGYGVITTEIDFQGSANIRAVGGVLTISDNILKVNQIGAETGAILNVTNPWIADIGVVGTILMAGGTLQGGQVTVNTGNGVQGFGTVTSRVINNSKLLAVNGNTLVFETAANDNDWDGAANTGLLQALSGDLELRDNATFGFGGTVTASNNRRVYTKGFGFDFNPGSTLNLTTATLQADETTTLGGTVAVGVGGESSIEVQNNRFLEFESTSVTTLNSNLRLKNNNIIVEDGATFSGTGAIIVPDGSHMVAENGADFGVLLDMQGAFRPGNSQGIARVDILDFQTAPSSELFFEFIGTSLNAYDRLVVDGTAVVDGFLSLDIDDISPGVPFVPVLGNTFNIITATSVIGTFDTVDVSGMPAGLAFHVNYLANAVQLQVVNKPIFDADFDDDGDVDSTDLAIWRNAYNLNQLGDADGDNDSDGRDFLIWQRQFGSAPFTALSANLAVPEPTSLVLLLGVCLGVGISRRI
jgi:hypothetical protein